MSGIKEVKHHSLLLAGDVAAKNFAVETLAQNPALTRAGQIWVHGVDKSLNYSMLNAQGALVVKTVTDKATFDEAVAALVAQIEGIGSGSSAGLDAERAARIAAINALTTALNEEVAARIAADSTEQAARIKGDADEAARADAAIAAVQAGAADALSTEAAARIAGDAVAAGATAAVSAELDRTQVGAGLAADGAYVPKVDANFIAGATNLAGAIGLLDVQAKAEEASRQAADAALSSAIANEAQLRADADLVLKTQIEEFVRTQIVIDNATDAERLAAEVALRIEADSAIKAELARTQASIGLDEDGNLIAIVGTNYMDGATTVFGAAVKLDLAIKANEGNVAAETAARIAGDTALQTAVDTEKARAMGAETAIVNELNTVESGVGLETDGSWVAPVGTSYLSGDGLGGDGDSSLGAANVKDGLVKLDAAIKSVSDRAGSLETTALPALAAQIAAEVARATKAETDEATARTQADSLLATGLATEATERKADVTRIDAALAKVKADSEAADVSLQEQLDDIVAASGSGATALKAALNAGRFNYLASAPAFEHTITHNFGHNDFIARVSVQGADGVFRYEIVSVEDIDTNVLLITLAESSKIRVSLISTATIL